jgi:hypothetical protein
MTVSQLQRKAGISRNAAGKYRRTFLAEAEAATTGQQSEPGLANLAGELAR